MTVDIATLAIRIDSLEAQNARRDLDTMTESGGRAEAKTITLASAFKTLGAVMATLKVIDFAKDAIMLAARYETLGVTMRVAGNNAGYTNTQMLAYQKTLQQTGISMAQSRNALTQLATSNIDLAKAQDLARVAQNLAVVANKNSSKALEDLIHGIKSAETEVLQTLGINIKFETGYKSMARTLGTTSDKLTEHQKLLSRTNQTLIEATKYNDIYEQSLSTAGKAMSSLSRYWEDLKTKTGETFLPVLSEQVKQLTEALKAANAEIEKSQSKELINSLGNDLLTAYKYISKHVLAVAADIASWFAKFIITLKGFAQQANALAHLDWKKFKDAGAQSADDFHAAGTGADAFRKKMMEVEKQGAKTAEQIKVEAAAREVAAIAAGNAARAQAAADEKAEAAADKAAEAKKKQVKEYEEAVKSAKDLIATMQIETSEIGKGEDQIKMMAAARAAAKAPTAALRLEIMQGALALDIEAKAFAASEAAKKSVADATQALADSRASEYAAMAGEVQANNEAILTYGMSKTAIEALTLARMEDRLARRGPQDLDLDEAEVNHLMRMIGLQKEKSATAGTLDVLDTGSSVAKAKELLDILTAVDAATKSAADGMAASFGKVGSAIGGLTTALSGYAVQQQAIAAQLATVKADPKSSTAAIAKAEIAAAQQSAQAKVKSYGDMAGAAKGFFKENSTGYKLMQTTEKAFRAYEMAMAVESMIKKIFFKEAEVAANIALNGTKLTGEVVTTAASTGLAATEASAWGITAVVKALASLPFPLNLAAGAATLAAVVAIGATMMGGAGGGSVSVSEQRQAANGTGTVLGDSSAKSESIAHSLAIMEKNSGLGLAYSSSMVVSLKQIVSGIGGLGSLLVQSDTLTTSLATQGSSSGWLGSIVSSIFGGKTTVQDAGIVTGKTSLGALDTSGLNVNSYVDTKKSGGWFSSDKYNSALTGLGAETSAQFTKIILGLRTTIVGAADMLGLGGDAFTTQLNTFVVDLGKISLKDLKGEELQAALETAFSKAGDDMARYGVAGLEQYQAVGEGYLETLARVANNYMQVSDVLAVLDKSFNVTGLGAVALSESLITAAGDLDTLTSNTSFFVQNFLSEAEQMAPITKSVQAAMTALGQSGVTTADQFKALVLAQDLNTAAGQSMYAQLIAIAEPFKKAADYAAELAGTMGDLSAATKTASEIASERKDLLQQLNELTKTETELLAIQRAGIADVNKALFDQVQAAKAVVSAKDALAKAYDTELSAAKSALGEIKTWATTVGGLNASLAMGAQSTLTPMQKYAEASAQLDKTLAAANAGDTTARSALDSVEKAFLAASQVVNASDAKYAADYARVLAANDEAAKWAGMQVDVQQASLDALTASVSGLITINDSVLTVAQGIKDLQAAMDFATGLGVQFDGSHAGGLTNVPFDGYAAELHRGEVVVDAQAASAMRRYFGGSPSQGGGNTDALVAEVKLLRAEVAAQRADQAKQVTAQIGSNLDANAKAAQKVADSVDKTTKAVGKTDKLRDYAQ